MGDVSSVRALAPQVSFHDLSRSTACDRPRAYYRHSKPCIEHLANVLLEAMACGTPEVVATLAAGVLMDERSAAAIGAGVAQLCANPPERAATRRYAEGFCWHGGHSNASGPAAFASRWARIFSMTCASSMHAMIRMAPPQHEQVSISMPKTRLRCCAHVIAARRSAAVGSSGVTLAPLPRLAGVTRAPPVDDMGAAVEEVFTINVEICEHREGAVKVIASSEESIVVKKSSAISSVGPRPQHQCSDASPGRGRTKNCRALRN